MVGSGNICDRIMASGKAGKCGRSARGTLG